MESFANQFDRNHGEPIKFDGRTLFWTYWLDVSEGDHVIIRFLRFVQRPVQGVGLRAQHCRLTVAGTSSKDVALWVDTAPRQIELQVTGGRKGARVGITNQWRDEKFKSTMYKLNNAAMEVQIQPDKSYLCRCSDGWGEPSFDDLVFLLQHRSHAEAEGVAQ